MEGGIDLLLRKLAGEVTSSQRRRPKLNDEDDDDDEDAMDDDDDADNEDEGTVAGDGLDSGGLLERVRGFNRFLEKAEKAIREANVRRETAAVG